MHSLVFGEEALRNDPNDGYVGISIFVVSADM